MRDIKRRLINAQQAALSQYRDSIAEKSTRARHLADIIIPRRSSGLIRDDSTRRGAGGALFGARQTGKDNGVAIYWATLKLYKAPALYYFVCIARLRAMHTHTHARALLRAHTINSRLITQMLSRLSNAVDGSHTSSEVTTNRGNDSRAARGKNSTVLTGQSKRNATVDEIWYLDGRYKTQIPFRYLRNSG